ncbi:MAG: DUF4860 domain-containing protein [Clostridia bacterium]|nr:DUF4860 domain-containing protein [Clostridia bacterium]
MKKKNNSKNSISGLATLLMFGVFAVCIMSVLLTGAGAYKRLTQRDQASFSARTCSQYIVTKVRQAGSPDAVSVESFDGYDCLVFAEDIDGWTYVTRVYCCDGWLCELFTAEDGGFLPEDGEKVVEAEDLKVYSENGLINVSVTDREGYESSFCLNVRGMEVSGI